MRGLRKDGPAPRGVRPGLLASRAARAVLVAAAALLLGGCPGRAPAGSASAENPSNAGAWFQIRDGTLRPVGDPGAAQPVPRAPWTVQSRVADLAFLGSDLYAGLNGIGLARLGRNPDGSPQFSTYSDSLIFGHRTITTLVPRDGGLTIHLYYNALLNDTLRQDLALAGISLVSFIPKLADFSFLVPPFQRRNPGWEAVGFAPESENSFDFEWKYTDASETRFQYTRFHADTRTEEPESRDTFLAALGVPFIEGPSVPADLAAFFSACRASLPPQPPTASLLFSLRSRESPIKRSYRSRKESESATVIPVFQEQGTLLALLPDRRLLSSTAGGAPRLVRLPGLPQGFVYSDVVKWGDALVLPWEEDSFTDVARAGILVYPWPAR
jgi:hypothetical protein